jgi:hypothetical protein
VRKYPSCKKILREVKKVMKISLVHTNGKKECSLLLTSIYIIFNVYPIYWLQPSFSIFKLVASSER